MLIRHPMCALFLVGAAVTAAGCIGGSSSSNGGSGSGSFPDANGSPSLQGGSARACLNENLYRTGSSHTAVYRWTFELRSDPDGDPADPLNVDATFISEYKLTAQGQGAAVFEPTGREGVKFPFTNETLATKAEVDGEPVDTGDGFGMDDPGQAGEGEYFVAVDIQAGEVRDLGQINRVMEEVNGGISQTTVVDYNDPYVLRRYDLDPEQSYQQTYRQMYGEVAEGEPLLGANFGDFDGLEITRTVIYEGREQVTVPAGTFDACRFTISESHRSPVTGTLHETTEETWDAVGYGINLLTRSDGGIGQHRDETVLLAAEIDGNPL